MADIKSNKGAIEKQADFQLDVPAAPPAGMERVTDGAEFAGYWRQAKGDIIDGVLRGPAPDKVIEASKSPEGVCIVELLHDCVVTNSKKSFDQMSDSQKKLWSKGQPDKEGKDTFVRKAVAGELVFVSIRHKAKGTFTKPDGTKIWVKVGEVQNLANGNTMYTYECYATPPAGTQSASGGGDAQPMFDPN